MAKFRHSFKKSKYNAKKTKRGDITFDSQLEARYYDKLVLLQKAGVILFFLRQPAFDLPGGVKYRADFLVFYTNGASEIIDNKGVLTKDFIMKKKMVEALYPVEITVIK